MPVKVDKYVNNFIFIVIVAAYFEFFRFEAIPSTVRMIAGPLTGCVLLILIILKLIYGHPGTKKMYFTLPIILLLIGSIPSYFTASAFHDQPFLISLFVNAEIWFYLLYFYLHFYQISVKFVLRIIVFTGLFAVLLYYIQFYMYPTKVLDIVMLEQRGTIRLLVAGMLGTQASYFYFLSRFLTERKIMLLLFALLCLSIFMLQGTRQLVFGIGFLTFVFVLLSRQIKNKGFIIVLIILALVAFFFAFREIINEMIKITNTSDSSGLIRIKAAKYYLTKFMHNDFAYIFGNGDAGPGSSYYRELGMIAVRHRYFLADIGIIGDYVLYGIVFVIGGLLFIFKPLIFTISPEYRFLKFYILSQCFTLFTGKGIFGGVDIIIVMILYIFDNDRFNTIRNSINTENADIEKS